MVYRNLRLQTKLKQDVTFKKCFVFECGVKIWGRVTHLLQTLWCMNPRLSSSDKITFHHSSLISVSVSFWFVSAFKFHLSKKMCQGKRKYEAAVLQCKVLWVEYIKTFQKWISLLFRQNCITPYACCWSAAVVLQGLKSGESTKVRS